MATVPSVSSGTVQEGLQSILCFSVQFQRQNSKRKVSNCFIFLNLYIDFISLHIHPKVSVSCTFKAFFNDRIRVSPPFHIVGQTAHMAPGEG